LITLQVFFHASTISKQVLPVFNLGGISIHITDLMILLAIFLTFYKLISGEIKFKERFSLNTILLLLLVFTGIVGLLNGVFIEKNGLNNAVRDSRDFFLYFTYFLTLSLNATRKNLLVLCNVIIAIAVISSCFSILQATVGDKLPFLATKTNYAEMELASVTRVGTLASPTFSFALLLCFFKLCEKITIKRLGLLMLILPGFILLFARAATISVFFGICCVILFVELKLKKRMFAGVTVTAITVLLFFSMGFMGLLGGEIKKYSDATVDRFSTLVSFSEDSSFMGRFKEANMIMPRIKKKPILGHGFGAVAQRVNWDQGSKFRNTSFIHIGYVNIAFRLGFLGMFFYVCLLFYSNITGVRRIKHYEDLDLKSIHLASTAFVIALIPLCFTQPVNMEENWIIMFSIISAMIQFAILDDEAESDSEGSL
jgi:hypothetical protein